MRVEKINISPDTRARIRDLRALRFVGQNDDMIIAAALECVANTLGYTFDDCNNCVPKKK